MRNCNALFLAVFLLAGLGLGCSGKNFTAKNQVSYAQQKTTSGTNENESVGEMPPGKNPPEESGESSNDLYKIQCAGAIKSKDNEQLIEKTFSMGGMEKKEVKLQDFAKTDSQPGEYRFTYTPGDDVTEAKLEVQALFVDNTKDLKATGTLNSGVRLIHVHNDRLIDISCTATDLTGKKEESLKPSKTTCEGEFKKDQGKISLKSEIKIDGVEEKELPFGNQLPFKVYALTHIGQKNAPSIMKLSGKFPQGSEIASVTTTNSAEFSYLDRTEGFSVTIKCFSN